YFRFICRPPPTRACVIRIAITLACSLQALRAQCQLCDATSVSCQNRYRRDYFIHRRRHLCRWADSSRTETTERWHLEEHRNPGKIQPAKTLAETPMIEPIKVWVLEAGRRNTKCQDSRS